MGALPGGWARAGQPAAPPSKSQILRWDDAKSNQADWGEMRRYFTGHTSATKDVLVAVAVVQPGKAVHKAHRHAEEEYLALIEGTGTWTLDGKESPARRGDILYTEPWVYHGVTNTGDAPLIFLVVRYNGKGVQPPPQPDDRPNELAGPADAAREAAPRTAKITGRVMLNGKPMADADVVFTPQQGRPAACPSRLRGRPGSAGPVAGGQGVPLAATLGLPLYINSEASFLEGNKIEDQGDVRPRFMTTATVQQYAPLDQYLMGLRAPEDVPPTFLVESATISPAVGPMRGISFDGSRRDVAVNEIIRAEGRRGPDHTVAVPGAGRSESQRWNLPADSVGPFGRQRGHADSGHFAQCAAAAWSVRCGRST